jgi:gamma-glutamyltranspeptidase/glutathione hydrolase
LTPRQIRAADLPARPAPPSRAVLSVGFALAVTHPFAGNIGGGGYMLIRLADGRATFIDFRERAPGGASRTMYLDAQGNPTRDSIEGWRSGVPGTVHGSSSAHTLRHADVGRQPGTRHQACEHRIPVSYPAESLRESRGLRASESTPSSGVTDDSSMSARRSHNPISHARFNELPERAG